MSLTIVARKPGKPASRVRIGGEYDKDGVRGFVLLSVSPRLALLSPGTARHVARALVRFAERTRRGKEASPGASLPRRRLARSLADATAGDRAQRPRGYEPRQP